MSFLGFGPRSTQPNRLGSIQIQTSERGVPIPYAGGTVKLPIKLLDYVDFNPVAQTSSGGGKGGGGISAYEYYASIDAALCDGPIGGIGNVYDSGGSSSLVGTYETYTIPAGGGTFRTYWNTTEQDEGVTYSAPYSYQANDFGSDGEQTLTGTHDVPMQKVSGAPGAGQYAVTQDANVTASSQGVVTGSGGYLHYSFSAADAGKTVTMTYTYASDSTNYVSPAAKFNFGIMPGTAVGSQWGYMASKHPERALRYPGIARVVAQNLDLGSDASPPNVSLEVLNARGLSFGGGIADCDPAAIIADICASDGAGFSWPYLGDLTQLSSFCIANNLFQSVAYDSQRRGLDVLQEIIDLANSEAVWSGPKLKIIPYGDQTATANGRTYVPATTPIYKIELSDIASKPGEEPIKSSWVGLADNYNSIQFQYTRRDDNYNNDVLNDKDEASILMNGLLPMKTITGDNYREKEYAAVAMNMLLKRNCVALRNHTFKLKWWYFLLEPMDIITIPTRLGPATPVRIVSVEEADDYSLSIVAEDFLFGVGQGYLYPKGDGAGLSPGAHSQPGATQVLAAFQPNARVTNGANQLWLALSGGASWGGCSVWISKDGTNYARMTDPGGNTVKQYGSARAGSLTAPIAGGPDPDTSDSISISITGSLSSGTQADADAYATLCLIGNELISYETAALTGSSQGSNSYNLGTYLRRGVFANNSQAHNAGEIFVRLDNQIVKYTIDPTLAGQIVYLKFTSFNLYGLEEQSLSDVTAQAINLGGSTAASNMAVGSYLNADGSATVDVYRVGGAVGDSGSVTTPAGVTITLPAANYAQELAATWYGVNYNPGSNAGYLLYTDQNAWLADQINYIPIGSTTTPTAGTAGAAGALYASKGTDTGTSPTSNPNGAISAQAGQSSVVTSSASAYSNGGDDPQPLPRGYDTN